MVVFIYGFSLLIIVLLNLLVSNTIALLLLCIIYCFSLQFLISAFDSSFSVLIPMYMRIEDVNRL